LSNHQNETSSSSIGDMHSLENLRSIYDMGLTAQSTEEMNLRYNCIKEMQLLLDGTVDAPSEYIAKLKAKAQSQQRSTTPTMNNIRTWSSFSSSSSSISTRFKKMSIVPIYDNTLDLQTIWDTIQKGKVCDGQDILDVTQALETLVNVAEWCTALKMIQEKKNDPQTIGGHSFQYLPQFGDYIQVDLELYQLLQTALDVETGQLSSTTFPSLGRLRSQIRLLKADILATVNTLLTSPSMKSKLSLESGGTLYSEVNGRIVIPVYDQVSNTVGIVHDLSRSGKTAYCEPTEIVAPTNEMRRAEAELQREEAIIWRMLTKRILEKEQDIQRSIYAVALLDLVLARIRLGERLGGVIPQVSNEGIVTLTNAKHPILILRNVANIVGNDIHFGVGSNQGLILTGPNSGGKTLILKLIGLCALMARDGIPIPASSDNARVDFFTPVLADIGDIQSVGGDLSTFSGHMLVCREVLSNSGKNALVLMDELGSGTDPRQGVAIAQALLEAIVMTGAKVAITTHYFELKQLAASDPRFSVAGMQFVNGRPTYKLLPGVVGESFALSVAERLKLPSNVISRANELLDTETRQMGDLLREMEVQKSQLDKQIEEMKRKQYDLEILELEMKKQQEKLERMQLTARKEEAAKFAENLREKEIILEGILEKLKSDPSRKVVARSWDDIKYVKRDVLNEVESLSSMMRRSPLSANKDTNENSSINWIPLSELGEKPNLSIGDTVYICKKGSFMGKLAKVVSVGGNRVDVSVNGIVMSMKMNELAISLAEDRRKDVTNVATEENKLSKLARKALIEESLMGQEKGSSGRKQSPSSADARASNVESSGTIRLKTNTIDVLGCTFHDAKQKCEEKFSLSLSQKNPVVYILHGHGTQGVLKEKIREWLQRDRQWVKKWKPADAMDGGDAFTMVELKKLQV